MAKMVFDKGVVEDYAQKLNSRNDVMKEKLNNIQKVINSLEGTWQSDSAAKTREKITGMTPRFEQYYNVVKNYATFLHNEAEKYTTMESGLIRNAEKFV